MKISLALKIAALSVAAVVSFTVSSSLVKARQKGVASHGQTIHSVVETRGSSPLTSAKGVPPVAGGVMKELFVGSMGRTILIQAQAKVMETRPDVGYLWVIRIRKTNSTEIYFEVPYLDQMFSPPLDQVTDINFEDLLELPLDAGVYSVEVTAFAITPQFGIEGVFNPETMPFMLGPSGKVRIQLQ